MKLAASNVDLRGEGAGVTVAFVPVKYDIRVCKCALLTTVFQILVLASWYQDYSIYQIPIRKQKINKKDMSAAAFRTVIPKF